LNENTEFYELMLAELEGQELVVWLTPAPRPSFEGHMVRTCFDKNTPWYRQLCADFPSSRRRRNMHSDTRIKRQNVLAQLRKLAAGGHTKSYIADELTKIAERRRTEEQPF